MRGDQLCNLIYNVIVDNTPPTFRVPICTLGGSARPEVRGTAEPHGGAYPP